MRGRVGCGCVTKDVPRCHGRGHPVRSHGLPKPEVYKSLRQRGDFVDSSRTIVGEELRSGAWPSAGEATQCKAGKLDLHGPVYVSYPERLALGCHVVLNEGCYFETYGGLTIGDYVHIARCCTIYPIDHNYRSRVSIPYDDIFVPRPVNIEDCVWVGSNASRCPGSHNRRRPIRYGCCGDARRSKRRYCRRQSGTDYWIS